MKKAENSKKIYARTLAQVADKIGRSMSSIITYRKEGGLPKTRLGYDVTALRTWILKKKRVKIDALPRRLDTVNPKPLENPVRLHPRTPGTDQLADEDMVIDQLQLLLADATGSPEGQRYLAEVYDGPLPRGEQPSIALHGPRQTIFLQLRG